MPVSKYAKPQKRTPQDKLKKPDVFVCTRCGTLFDKVGHRSKFATVKSPLWESNDRKLPICNECLNFYYNFYEQALGDAYSAFRRVCMKLDIYYNDAIVDSVISNDQSSKRLSAYLSQLNYARYQDKTYDNTIEEESGKLLYGDCIYNGDTEDGKTVNYKVEYEKLKTEIKDAEARDGGENDPECEELFGFGFVPREQKIMKRYYLEQKEQIPSQLITTLDESLKDLAKFKILQGRAIAKNDLSEVTKYSDQFNKVRKYVDETVAKFKKSAASEESNILFGTLVDEVEHFNPAEIYKKKTIFSDVDGLISNISRFLARAVRNFFTGSRDMDPEYEIDGDDQ